MTEPPARLALDWSKDAKAQLRAIDRDTALSILYCVDRYSATREGDVKKLSHPMSGLRLRCGDYRVFYQFTTITAIRIDAVRHRKQAYRRLQ